MTSSPLLPRWRDEKRRRTTFLFPPSQASLCNSSFLCPWFSIVIVTIFFLQTRMQTHCRSPVIPPCKRESCALILFLSGPLDFRLLGIPRSSFLTPYPTEIADPFFPPLPPCNQRSLLFKSLKLLSCNFLFSGFFLLFPVTDVTFSSASSSGKEIGPSWERPFLPSDWRFPLQKQDLDPSMTMRNVRSLPFPLSEVSFAYRR